MPSSHTLLNSAYLGYSYTVDPISIVNVVTGTTTNTTLTTINYSDLSDISKSVDQQFTSLNTTLNYTISFSNKGTLDAGNTIFMDTVPLGTTFIPESVKINGISSLTANPALPGINLGTINVNQRTTITFSVLTTISSSYSSFSNVSQASYNYTLGTLTSSTLQAISNIVVTTLSIAILSASKSVDKTYINIGDVLTYSIPITNTGNTTAINVILIDTVPLGLTFVENSLTQDGVVISGSPNPPGITINDIAPNTTTTVTFQGTVISRPPSGMIKNEANITYSYLLVPSPVSTFDSYNDAFSIFDFSALAITVTTSVNTSTNTVVSYFKDADLSNLSKSVSSNFAGLNTTLTYTVVFTNTGKLDANNVVLIDTIPDGTSFVPGSVYINGVNNPTASPVLPGINLGTVAQNSTYTINFDVVVSPKVPYPNLISNMSEVTYNYPSTSGGTISSQNSSNTTVTVFSSAIISASKTVDKTSANIGDILTYTIHVTNTGNTTAQNVYFTDKISSNLAIIPHSFKVNNVSVSGSIAPPGIALGDIPSNTTVIVTFQAKVMKPSKQDEVENTATINYSYTVDPNKLPTNASTNTNTVATTINTANLSNIRKKVNKTDAMIGDILTYTISMSNTGSLNATNVFLKDMLSSGAEFIPGSVVIDGVPNQGANPTLQGLNLGIIQPNQRTTITFDVAVTPIIPHPCTVNNTAKVSYHYVSGNHNINASAVSNTTVTELASIQIPFKG